MIAGRVKVLNLETGEYDEQDIPAEQNPTIQAVAKPLIDKKNVLYVFQFADEVVKYVLKRLGESLVARTHITNRFPTAQRLPEFVRLEFGSAPHKAVTPALKIAEPSRFTLSRELSLSW